MKTKTRLLSTAAAFAVAGSTVAATTGTAHAASDTDSVRITSVQAGSAAASAVRKKFSGSRSWGSVRGVMSLKVVTGVMTDRKNDGRCVQVTVYWGLKKPGKKGRILDTDRASVCGKNRSRKFRSTPDYRGRPFKANGVYVGLRLLPRH
ncbi:hypothetical protein SMC26_28985 [Actinomadura fulvescens]|uniref:Secreted protein n=1 Tax=Actinomadura fulvescens TaxID=46160 RepID=A0ABN3PYF9_9ACTN